MVGHSSRHRRQSSTIPVRNGSSGEVVSHDGMDYSCLMVDSSLDTAAAAAFQQQQQQQQQQQMAVYNATHYHHLYPPPHPHHYCHPPPSSTNPYHPVSYHTYHPVMPAPPPAPPQFLYGQHHPPSSTSCAAVPSSWPSRHAPPSPPPLRQQRTVRFQLPDKATAARQELFVGLSVAAAFLAQQEYWNPHVFWYSAAELNRFRWQTQVDARRVAMPPTPRSHHHWPEPPLLQDGPTKSESPREDGGRVPNDDVAAEDDVVMEDVEDLHCNNTKRLRTDGTPSFSQKNDALYVLRKVIRNLYQACQEVTDDTDSYPCMSYHDQRIVARAPIEFLGLERWMKRLRLDKAERLQQMHAMIREEYQPPPAPKHWRHNSYSAPQERPSSSSLVRHPSGDGYPPRRSPSPDSYHDPLGYFVGTTVDPYYYSNAPPSFHPSSSSYSYGFYGAATAGEYKYDYERAEDDYWSSNSRREESIRLECERISLPSRLFAFYMANAARCE